MNTVKLNKSTPPTSEVDDGEMSVNLNSQQFTNKNKLSKVSALPTKTSETDINSITEILEDIRLGKMVILVDDEERENEGDLIIAAEKITPEIVNFMATHGRGLICLPISESHCQKLGLTMMTDKNLSSHKTAFTVSIEAAKGITTGISAADRAHTIKAAVDKDSTSKDIVQPGHIFPLKACKGGVLTRPGHTEAACDLARLSGLSEAGVICEILKSDGSMARLDDLLIFAREHGLKVGTIADLIEYRMTSEMLIEHCSSEKVNIFGDEFTLHTFKDTSNEQHHIAITHGIGADNKFNEDVDVLVRVHHPFTSLDFMVSENSKNSNYKMLDCLREISKSKAGVLVGLRSNAIEEQKLIRRIQKTKNSSTKNGVNKKNKWDPKLYGTGAQILRILGIRKIHLLSHPINLANIKGFGLEINEFKNL